MLKMNQNIMKFMHLKHPNILKQIFPTFGTVITVADNEQDDVYTYDNFSKSELLPNPKGNYDLNLSADPSSIWEQCLFSQKLFLFVSLFVCCHPSLHLLEFQRYVFP